MNVEFSNKFAKQFRNCLDKRVKAKIVAAIDECEKSHSIRTVKNIKKLTDYKNAYRIKVDDFRIGIELKNNTILFVSLYNRKEFYRFFP